MRNNKKRGVIFHYDGLVLGVGHTPASAWRNAVANGLDPNGESYLWDEITHCAVSAVKKSRPAYVDFMLVFHEGDTDDIHDFGHYGLKRGCAK